MDTKDIDSRQIGKIISEARKVAGLSQLDLACKLGLDKRTISTYENGTRKVHAARLVKIAKILNISIDSLTGIDNSKVDGRSRTVQIVKKVEQLPSEEQKLVLGMIQTLSTKHVHVN